MKYYRLFTPGPTELKLDLKKILKKGFPYHREESFSELLFKIEEKLKKMLFLTHGRVFLLTSSGTGAMEASVLNIFDRKDKLLIASTGKFGERWREICKVWNIPHDFVSFEYGKSVDISIIEKKLKKKKYTGILTTLTETSTGALNNVKEIAKIKKNAILVVDAIAGFGADKLKQEEEEIDVVVGGSQKALVSPPGISFIAVNERVLKKIKRRKKPKSYYFDLLTYEEFLQKGQTPYTPAILTLLYMYEVIEKIEKQGFNKILKDYEKWSSFVRKKAQEAGFKIFPQNPSNALVVLLCEKKSDLYIEAILKKFRILFANGQKELKGKIIRIGMMGHANKKDVELICKALFYAKKRIG